MGESGPALTAGQLAHSQEVVTPRASTSLVHELADLAFRHARLGVLEGLVIDVERRVDGPADAGDLGFGLAPAQLHEQRLRRDESLRIRGVSEVAVQQLESP